MANLNASQIYALARGAGFSAGEAVTATAIALAESAGNPAAIGDTSLQTDKWGPSVGLWQVRTLKAERGRGTIRDYDWLMNSVQNQAKAAYEIRKGSNGWANWSVFTNGKYKANVTAVESTVGTQESLDQGWWQKLLSNPFSAGSSIALGVASAQAIAGGASVSDVTSVAGDYYVGGTAEATGLGSASDAVQNVNQLLNTVQSAAFWKRFGIGAGGVLVILLAVLVMVWAGRSQIVSSVVPVGKAVKKLTK